MKHRIFKSQIPGLQGHYLWHVECPERNTTYDYTRFDAAVRMRGCCQANPYPKLVEADPTQPIEIKPKALAWINTSRWGSG